MDIHAAVKVGLYLKDWNIIKGFAMSRRGNGAGEKLRGNISKEPG